MSSLLPGARPHLAALLALVGAAIAALVAAGGFVVSHATAQPLPPGGAQPAPPCDSFRPGQPPPGMAPGGLVPAPGGAASGHLVGPGQPPAGAPTPFVIRLTPGAIPPGAVVCTVIVSQTSSGEPPSPGSEASPGCPVAISARPLRPEDLPTLEEIRVEVRPVDGVLVRPVEVLRELPPLDPAAGPVTVEVCQVILAPPGHGAEPPAAEGLVMAPVLTPVGIEAGEAFPVHGDD